MKVLEAEIGLRDETRTLHQARPALAAEKVDERVAPLAETQHDLAQRVADIGEKIQQLPNADSFTREIGLMTRVQQVMHEAALLLDRAETGPDTVAAETEAIELLMQARRVNPQGGGGNGGSTPGGGGGGTTDESALALLGDGSEEQAADETREVGQATGLTGGNMPAEFRQGLDTYFNAFEQYLRLRSRRTEPREE